MNLRDGINGLAGGEAAVASSFFFLVFAAGGFWVRGKEKPQNRDVPANSR